MANQTVVKLDDLIERFKRASTLSPNQAPPQPAGQDGKLTPIPLPPFQPTPPDKNGPIKKGQSG